MAEVMRAMLWLVDCEVFTRGSAILSLLDCGRPLAIAVNSGVIWSGARRFGLICLPSRVHVSFGTVIAC